MKTVIEILVRLCCITVLILSFSACRSKHLNNQRFRTSAVQTKDINIKTTQDDFYQRSSVISIRDSAKHQYQVNIFPIDSFSFSLQEGFRGRAHAIELKGEIHQRKETSELHGSTAKKQHSSNYHEEAKISGRAKGNNKDLKKKSFNLIVVLVFIGFIGLVAYFYKRYYGS